MIQSPRRMSWLVRMLHEIDATAARLFPGGEIDHTGRLVYNGPASLARVEQLLNRVRVVPLVAAITLFPFLGFQDLAPIYIIITLFAVDLLVMEFYIIRKRTKWLYSGHLRFTIDCCLIGSSIAVTGGVSSALIFMYYPILAIHCLRFGRHQTFYGPIAASLTLLIAIFYAHGEIKTHLGFAVFHYSWLQLLAFVLTLVVDRGRMAEARLTEELRRTRALLQAAHAPAASLNVPGVLASVLEQAIMLTESQVAAVAVHDELGQSWTATDYRPSNAAGKALMQVLLDEADICDTALAKAGPVKLHDLIPLDDKRLEPLADVATVIVLLIPGQARAQGVIGVARAGEPHEQSVHYEALSAFLERAALAIQNARLYERLQEQVDELQAMHDQIVRTERLAAIGEIAAKVAHELNNPLTSIHLYNSMLLEEPVEGAEQQRLAASMLEQVERAKRVVRDILDFSRPQESHPEIASLNGTVAQSLQLVEHAARASGVSIVEDYAGGLPEVLVDTGQMAQIFTNLATNAIQAMPDGGKLLVRTGMQGEELFVSFADTGSGISLADRDRIFEPFFTTKAAGEGTGLGLSVVKGLVSRHHGRVTVDSESGRGSTFTVWLPPAMETEREGLVARPQRR